MITDTPDFTQNLKPKPNGLPAVWDLVIADILRRDVAGAHKYGTRLQPFNGRDYTLDAYEEALDLVVYLRGKLYEEERGISHESKQYRGWFVLVALIIGVGIGYLAGIWARV